MTASVVVQPAPRSVSDLALAVGFYPVACLGITVGYRRYFTHRALSDREGDPHSPWLFGTGPVALATGFWQAHMGWLFERVSTNAERFARDLLADQAPRSSTGSSSVGRG